MENITMEISYASTKIYSTLEEINASKAQQRLPTVIFLTLLMIIGVIGNTLVIVVYSRKYPPSMFRLYILSLAIIDLLSGVFAMPVEIVDNAYPVMFYSEALCKCGRFIGNVFKIGSAFVLVLIAGSRYKKICRPFSTATTLLQARLYCGATILLAIALSWPNAFVQGLKHVHLPGNITGFDCTLDEDIVNTQYPFIYYTIIFAVNIIVFLLLAVLYTFVILSLRKHNKNLTTKNLNEKLNKTNPRITKLMIAITVAFILSYLPNCILDATSTFKRGLALPPSPVVLATLPLLARAFFINNVINPFIYLVGESKFRKIVYQSLRWLYYTICCPKEKQNKSFAITD
ncbi:rhodopsin, GQ-coupled-like [Saccostrea cucullata]|uniref:rhodopsin, GQ-coupled-like n=1 Tax=Saccostrea cuccullata TaxID=36930 RepID=UPI002ED5AB13